MSNDTREENFESRWPRATDRLFIKSIPATDAYVARDPGERFYRLPKSYKVAGDILLDRTCTDLANRDNLIYVALFCYRQAIELFLKRLIQHFGNTDYPKTHNLKNLWRQFVGVGKKYNMEQELADELKAVENLVEEMDKADEWLDGFRYPTTKKGEKFPFGDRGIDQENLREVMQGLANFLECAGEVFAHKEDMSRDVSCQHGPLHAF